jgi:thiamine-monophosphate kinase
MHLSNQSKIMPPPPKNEQTLIATLDQLNQSTNSNLILGIGDDAAKITTPQGKQLVTSSDNSIAGVHLPLDVTAEDFAYRALARSLSDLAAMGAKPAFYMQNITHPNGNASWFEQCVQGQRSLVNDWQLNLIGGDLSQGPLSIACNVFGWCNPGANMQRNNAQPGDLICITNTLGDAAAGLALWQKKIDPTHFTNAQQQQLRQALIHPEPPIAWAMAAAPHIHAAIDLSDGLIHDLNHILIASKVGAQIDRHQIPLSSALQQLPQKQAHNYALYGGDDYQLCVTMPKKNLATLTEISQRHNLLLTVIGTIKKQPGLQLSPPLANKNDGFDHFITTKHQS